MTEKKEKDKTFIKKYMYIVNVLYRTFLAWMKVKDTKEVCIVIDIENHKKI